MAYWISETTSDYWGSHQYLLMKSPAAHRSHTEVSLQPTKIYPRHPALQTEEWNRQGTCWYKSPVLEFHTDQYNQWIINWIITTVVSPSVGNICIWVHLQCTSSWHSLTGQISRPKYSFTIDYHRSITPTISLQLFIIYITVNIYHQLFATYLTI